MDDGAIDWRAAARAEAYAMPLEHIDPVDDELFRNGTIEFYFERLRAEDPVHYSDRNTDGPYWSVTKYKDIMFVDTHHELFSSEPHIMYRDTELSLPSFINTDPPRHDEIRKAVTPAMSGPNLKELEPLIRSRVGAILDGLPRGEAFELPRAILNRARRNRNARPSHALENPGEPEMGRKYYDSTISCAHSCINDFALRKRGLGADLRRQR